MDEISVQHQANREEIGKTIRLLREQQGVSVRTLAKKAGFSASFISQVENGQASPSIGSMETIAHALGVTLSEFFARRLTEEEGPVVVRAGEGDELRSEWSLAKIRALSPIWQGRVLSPLLLTVDSGGRNGASPSGYRGELFAYVIEGQIQIRLGESAHILNAGDSIHLAAGREHIWENPGGHAAHVLLVTSEG